MRQIFVSYSSVDREWARHFQARLQATFEDYSVFLDVTSTKDETWWQTILEQIATSTLLIPILSNDFFQSIYCRAEYVEAQRIGIPIVPLLLRKAHLPLELEHRPILSISDWDTATPLPAAITAQLKAEPPPHPPRPILTTPTPHPDYERPPDWHWQSLPTRGWGAFSDSRTQLITNGSPPLPFMKPNRPAHTEPRTPDSFVIQGHDWLQVGCIAFFGVEDVAHIQSLSEKLTSLSFSPTEPYYSRMGEDVPEPENPYTDIRHTHYTEIDFTTADRILFDRAFLILYIATHTPDSEPAYVYVNCRGDRIGTLIEQIDSDLPFDVQQYATIIEVGSGRPSAATRERLARDYLFGETHLNVRIFPPLSDIT